MKHSKKKRKESTEIESTESFEKAAEEFADVIVESLREQHHSDLEPFEAYAERIRGKIHDNLDEFRSRFAKGYQILLEEIQKEQADSKKDDIQRHKTIKP